MSQGWFIDEEDVEEFFDSKEELPPLLEACLEENVISLFDRDSLYHVWTRSPDSIQQRRTMFRQMMGLEHVRRLQSDSDDSIMADFDRITSDYSLVLRGSEGKSGSPMPYCYDGIPILSEDQTSAVQFKYKIKNFDNDSVLVAGERFSQVGSEISTPKVCSSEMMTSDEFDRSFEASSSGQQFIERDHTSSNNKKTPRRRMVGWLRRLGVVACMADKQGHGFDYGISDSDLCRGSRLKVRVCTYKKQSKELSALYMRQKILAHHGAILTMKFSPDGEYLATGGEDGVVRVWKIMEYPRSNADDIPINDPSCIYFGLSQNSELSPLYIDKEKNIISKGLQRTSDSVCVVIPQAIFQICEEPFNEFHGHNGDVLDLAWSKDRGLLSSSSDNTVRLWKLGCDRCIKVFPHNNYVTCIQFNPIDERYFISGSIDGKARVWEIAACRVVDWTDVGEIITAVCYRLDGKVLVVGSIVGDCHFYDLSDNHLQLEAEISFHGRKKSVDKRITGFQFCPSNPLQLMVTSADSTVRILDGIDVISKYKGLRNSGSQISASFSSDGTHILSASEDSNVYMWNHSNHDRIPLSHNVKSIWSCEHFSSSNVSIAIPWQGLSCSPSSSSVTSWPQLFSDTAPKGSVTWPEENLPSSMHNPSVLGKSQLKFLKTSWQMNMPHAWGQVIVTAGRDGKIRSFQNFGLPVHL